jgi:hypothetical protein
MPQPDKQKLGAQHVKHLLNILQLPLPPAPPAFLPTPLPSGLMSGTCGWPRSGLVSVFALASFVGCLKGGGASVRMGIEGSPAPCRPGFRTNDFVNVAFRDGAIVKGGYAEDRQVLSSRSDEKVVDVCAELKGELVWSYISREEQFLLV